MIKSKAKQIALIAIMTATIEAGKLALSALPNIEVVSLLCASYGFAFGFIGVFATYIFVAIETLIWGFNTWVISYFIYWPLVAVLFAILGYKKYDNKFVATSLISLLTIFFGVLTSAVDTGLFMGTITLERFSIMYLRGIVFYAIQLCCNIILFLTAFKPLTTLLVTKIKPNFFQSKGLIEKHKNML